MTKRNILFTGATGYIGGSVLAKLLELPDISAYTITAIVRSPEKAEKLQALGINAVVGSVSDPAFVEKLASESDFVIATADADNFEATKAILNGLKKRFEATKTPPVLIHTSGTGNGGLTVYETIYDDANAEQMASIAPTQLHRNVDLEIIKADEEGYARTYIILPSTIYGLADNKLVKLGIQNPHSLQIPGLIKIALKRKQAGMVGEGKNLWPNVHISEVADIYILLFNAVKANPDSAGHGKEGYYFGENGEYRMYDVVKRFSEALYQKGLVGSPEPTTFTKEEIDEYLGGDEYIGSTARCKATRARSLGWKPTKTTKDFLDSLDAEVEALSKL